MATNNDIKQSIKNTNLAVETSLDSMLAAKSVRARFEDMLGKKAAGFLSSILSLVNTNQNLKVSDPKTILTSAAIAASLDLPINPSLGFAHIVPYSGKAQFQIGWKGLVQLAIRTGQYRTMNAAVVYEGELKCWNRITGEIEIDINGKASDKVIGYVAFFKLINGFEKYVYMTREEAEKHGKRYSKSFSSTSGRWQQDFDSMALKTVLKMLLSKYGILSVEMQKAIQADQSVVVESKEGEKFEYPDAVEAETVTPDEQKKIDESIDTTEQEDIPFGN